VNVNFFQSLGFLFRYFICYKSPKKVQIEYVLEMLTLFWYENRQRLETIDKGQFKHNTDNVTSSTNSLWRIPLGYRRFTLLLNTHSNDFNQGRSQKFVLGRYKSFWGGIKLMFNYRFDVFCTPYKVCLGWFWESNRVYIPPVATPLTSIIGAWAFAIWQTVTSLLIYTLSCLVPGINFTNFTCL